MSGPTRKPGTWRERFRRHFEVALADVPAVDRGADARLLTTLWPDRLGSRTGYPHIAFLLARKDVLAERYPPPELVPPAPLPVNEGLFQDE